jgi:predicted dinucleotide-binding enzyme
VEELGTLAIAGTNEDACNADAVILAVMWSNIPDVLNKLKKQLKGKIVVDVSNYLPEDGNFLKFEKPTGVRARCLKLPHET